MKCQTMSNQTKRKAISKKTRFEVFKRDKFTCQFCGQSSPNIILEIDHLTPISKGGDNKLINLITSCFDCNRGKSNNKLNDSTEIEKQKQSLNILQEKRNQLKMMSLWRKELMSLDNEFANQCLQIINDITGLDYELTDYGINQLIKLKKKYGEGEVLEVCEISARQYYNFPETKNEQSKQWNKAFDYIPKILAVRSRSKDDPILQKLYYCRAIIRNKSNFINEWKVLDYLKDLIEGGYSIQEIEDACRDCYNWSDFRRMFD